MRQARIDYDGARHHVMNRGSRRAPIFFDCESRKHFVKLLAELPPRFGIRIHGYVLMPNHYHLMIESNGELGRAMRHLGGCYTQQLNRRRGWDGPLFRGRYRNKVVETDDYWTHLLLYLHLNPSRAGLHAAYERWSSHGAYLGCAPTPGWLTTAELLNRFSGPRGYARDFDATAAGELEVPESFDPDALWAPNETGAVPTRSSRPVDIQAAIEDVTLVTGLQPSDLLASRRGPRGNPARWLLAWWMSRCRISHGDIRRRLGVDFNQVYRMIKRVERRRSEDPVLRRWTSGLIGCRSEN